MARIHAAQSEAPVVWETQSWMEGGGVKEV